VDYYLYVTDDSNANFCKGQVRDGRLPFGRLSPPAAPGLRRPVRPASYLMPRRPGLC
jgi:hypothetical protein